MGDRDLLQAVRTAEWKTDAAGLDNIVETNVQHLIDESFDFVCSLCDALLHHNTKRAVDDIFPGQMDGGAGSKEDQDSWCGEEDWLWRLKRCSMVDTSLRTSHCYRLASKLLQGLRTRYTS